MNKSMRKLHDSTRREYMKALAIFCSRSLVTTLREYGPRLSGEVLVVAGKISSPNIELDGDTGIDADWASATSMWFDRRQFKSLFASIPQRSRFRAERLKEFDELISSPNVVNGRTPVAYSIRCGGLPIWGSFAIGDVPESLISPGRSAQQ
jgi:hypothetical protein